MVSDFGRSLGSNSEDGLWVLGLAGGLTLVTEIPGISENI